METTSKSNSALRQLAALAIFALLLNGSGMILAWMFVPNNPEIAITAFVAIAIPVSIVQASKIRKVTYSGICLVGFSSLLMIWWYATLIAAGWRGVYGMELEASDYAEAILIAGVVTVALLIVESVWLYVLNELCFHPSLNFQRDRTSGR